MFINTLNPNNQTSKLGRQVLNILPTSRNGKFVRFELYLAAKRNSVERLRNVTTLHIAKGGARREVNACFLVHLSLRQIVIRVFGNEINRRVKSRERLLLFGPGSFGFQNMETEVHRTITLPVLCMGVKLGLN
jgi:hypothetical protein